MSKIAFNAVIAKKIIFTEKTLPSSNNIQRARTFSAGNPLFTFNQN